MKPKIEGIDNLKEEIAAAEKRIATEETKIAACRERIKRERLRIRQRREEILSREATLLAERYRASNMSLEDALAALDLSADTVQPATDARHIDAEGQIR